LCDREAEVAAIEPAVASCSGREWQGAGGACSVGHREECAVAGGGAVGGRAAPSRRPHACASSPTVPFCGRTAKRGLRPASTRDSVSKLDVRCSIGHPADWRDLRARRLAGAVRSSPVTRGAWWAAGRLGRRRVAWLLCAQSPRREPGPDVIQRCPKLGDVDVRVIQRALATIAQQPVKLGNRPGVWVNRVLEQARDLQQLAPHRRNPVAQQQLAPAANWEWVDRAIRSPAHPPGEHPARAGADAPIPLARGAPLPPTPQDEALVLDGERAQRRHPDRV
jgi:hypothetical protein